MARGELAHLAVEGARIEVRVTPRARRPGLTVPEDGPIRIAVTEVAEDGRANAAVTRVLAEALGIAPSRLTLERGATARLKLFRVD
ncbi:hypothetical protein CDV50_09415 [Haematobacter massiliensis]|uniref:Uncharacterized protein n=1 Tax=Haematobacter massiliensis TaxID=195105 RepID=A0A086YAT1_9RHOB|nr:DUF167 domain-containing protein [Haematobacter massiliensis]KFI31381.1 hypothetical protein CN97_10255 [Haematobacter massiliensis]OWJ71713.1 hypothetical protein CDV50_09415 [Haematobacter massiliensis]OWJ88150.1 hypothetical protein CDV51_03490 [Haematobacter massiliensis]QBJ23466.1 DUF167 domain-containing protein [Haematobacter massiliensis]